MKIKVNYVTKSELLEFTKLDNGKVMSYGRSLPF
jgi:hypothetical protein